MRQQGYLFFGQCSCSSLRENTIRNGGFAVTSQMFQYGKDRHFPVRLAGDKSGHIAVKALLPDI